MYSGRIVLIRLDELNIEITNIITEHGLYLISITSKANNSIIFYLWRDLQFKDK